MQPVNVLDLLLDIVRRTDLVELIFERDLVILDLGFSNRVLANIRSLLCIGNLCSFEDRLIKLVKLFLVPLEVVEGHICALCI